MIIDLEKFVGRERPYWAELEGVLDRLERADAWRLDLDQARRLHYLYERAAAGLAQVRTFSADPDVRAYVEALVARAYGLIHSSDRARRHFRPVRWFFGTFPRTFRRHVGAFALAAAVTAAGAAFGAFAVAFDPEAKRVLIPLPALRDDPGDRVRREEQADPGDREGLRSAFSSWLMTHNIRISAMTLALGATWGVGTIAILFYNGAILGALALDYVRAGQAAFLAGWLLPHGTVEIPAILVAGQAGLVLASAMIGRGDPSPLKVRLRQVLGDLVTLVFGGAVLLVWAGLVESFLSQYHWPVVPYGLKIAFGCVELGLLTAFLWLSGRKPQARTEDGP